MLFKLSRDEANDAILLEEEAVGTSRRGAGPARHGALFRPSVCPTTRCGVSCPAFSTEMVVSVLSSTTMVDNADALVYCCGATKNLSNSSASRGRAAAAAPA